MRNKNRKHSKIIIALALALVMGVSFMPVNTESSFAASFSTSGSVANLKVASYAYNYIKISWNAYSGATGYQVWRATSANGTYKKLGNSKGTSFKNTSVSIGSRYYYKVRAYQKSGTSYKYAKYSAVVNGRAKPQAPSVTASSGSSNVALSWKTVPNVTGYEVFRATSSNGSYSCIGSTSKGSFNNTSGKIGQVYYYKVRAYKTLNGKRRYGGFSGKKNAIMGLVAVSGVSATSATNGVQLNWAKVNGASGYEIQRASGASGYTVVGTAGTNSFLDKNVANGVTYSYKIRAYRTVGNSKVYGNFNAPGYSRSSVVSTAAAWLGCKESNKSNKPIIDLYNKNMGTKFSYTTAWCAMFVSAVAIKSGTTKIIVRGSYCPSVMSTYKNSKATSYKFGAGSKYVPKPGDVIFFDWNRNGVPDHTGLVASVSGNTVKTIEGNYSDAVGYRTFSVGYSCVLGYGLPNYDEACGILYTGQTNTSVGCGELAAMGIGAEPEGYDALGTEYDFVEQKVEDNLGCGEDVSDYDKMVYMVKKVRQNAESESADCSTSQYYAAFIYKLCQEAGLDGSIITAEDEEGNVNAWIEVLLDGKWYRVDASQQTDQIIEFVPEVTDIES